MKVSLAAMTEVATAARPVGILAKTARRVGVALTIAIGVGLLVMQGGKSPPSSIFLHTIVYALSATTAFAVFEVWPRRLPRWLQRWVLHEGAVGGSLALTSWLLNVLFTSPGAPPFREDHDRQLLAFLALL